MKEVGAEKLEAARESAKGALDATKKKAGEALESARESLQDKRNQ